MKFWRNGKIIEEKNPTGFNFSLNYSNATWEGVISNGIGIVENEAHANRLIKSAKAMNLKCDYNSQQIQNALVKLLSISKDKYLYFRPIIYKNELAEGVRSKNNSDILEIFSTPIKNFPKLKDTLKVCISSYQRSYPYYQMQIKNSSNYLIGQHAYNDAKRAGFDDALLIDNNGYITEATVANLFIVKDNFIYTPPSNGSILEGITREWVIKNYGVIEKPLTRYDVYTCDGAFLTGTFMGIRPIIQIDHSEINLHGLIADIQETYEIYKLTF